MQVKNSLIVRIHNTYFRTLYGRQIRCSSAIRKDEKEKEPLPVRIVKEKLSKKFPRTYKIFNLVKDGFTGIWNDGKAIFKLTNEVTGQKRLVSQLSLQELELYFERWNDIKTLIPLLVVGILPFGNGVVAFLAFWKPLKFLSSHFWTEKQKAAYVVQCHEQRVSTYEPIIRNLRAASIAMNRNYGSYALWAKILRNLQDGKIPAMSEVARCKDLFEHSPYALNCLDSNYIDYLMRLHVLSGFLKKKAKLEEWAAYIIQVDKRIKLLGGASQLPSHRLKQYCFQRGLNAHEMSEEEMRVWLNEFIKFSSDINGQNCSLILHAPAIFGINHPSNRSILKKL